LGLSSPPLRPAVRPASTRRPAAPPRGSPIPPLLHALRPHQWTKNLAIFVGILFAHLAHQIHDASVLLPVALLFVAFCLASSCVYLLNDIADREEDARHPVKRHRAIASGRLSLGAARLAAFTCAAAAIVIAWLLPNAPRITRLEVPAGVVVLVAYLFLNLAYTSILKRVVIADVTCIALGFLIRVVSGPKVAGLEVSSWLILCTFFGALFLACAKRRGELLTTEGTDGGRSVLTDYSDRVLDLLIGMSGSATLLCYAIYTVSAETLAKFHTDHLMYTVPFVFFGLGRYLLLLYRRRTTEDPARLLFTDPGLLLAIVSWVAASWAAIVLSG
jgi:4-hydroxybenzoate polyprenyltransferase